MGRRLGCSQDSLPSGCVLEAHPSCRGDHPLHARCHAECHSGRRSIGDTPLKTVEGWFARTRTRFAGEIRAPIGGLLKTREARGSLAMRRLACEADKYFLFRMKPQPWDSSGLSRTLRTCLLSWAMAPDGAHPPLGWLMGPAAHEQIAQQLRYDSKTVEKLSDLLQ